MYQEQNGRSQGQSPGERMSRTTKMKTTPELAMHIFGCQVLPLSTTSF